MPGKDANQQLELIDRIVCNAEIDRMLSGCDPLAVDLVKRMLTFKPELRITAADALKHPYLAKSYSCGKYPVTQEFTSEFDCGDDFKKLLYDEISSFHLK